MKKSSILVLCLAFLLLAGCAGPNTAAHTASAGGTIAGFWRGLWHGGIAPFAFFLSLFTNGVSVYEVHNNGAWYNWGFLIGVLADGCVCGAGAKKR